ncbi:MAG: hypothetical protein NVSMB26_12480 [Beijerinckiaceae bacterium]
MTKTFTFLSLLAALTLIGATFVGVPGPSVLQAQEKTRVEAADSGTNCRLVEVALDEGYGVTRHTTRAECDIAR